MVDDESTGVVPANPLDDMLCFNLYATTRATNRLSNTLLAPWHLTYPQCLVLKLLWSRKPATVGEISKSLMRDSGTPGLRLRSCVDSRPAPVATLRNPLPYNPAARPCVGNVHPFSRLASTSLNPGW